MKKITFKCETITPMFLAGADGQTPELRPPSIKGALRFWWRAMNGHLPLAVLKKSEGEIFGNGGEKATQSSFSIVVEHKMKTAKKSFVPHKSFMLQEAFIEGQSFTVKLLFKSDKYIHEIRNLFVLVSFLGGFGKRSRRGMGSFHIFKFVDVDGCEIIISKNLNLNNVFDYLKLISDKFSIVNNKIISNFGRGEDYPCIMSIELGKPDSGLLMKISNVTHHLKNVDIFAYEASLGNASKGRFASPVYVSVLRGNVPIITTLKTCSNRRAADVNKGMQEEFKKMIL